MVTSVQLEKNLRLSSNCIYFWLHVVVVYATTFNCKADAQIGLLDTVCLQTVGT